MVPRARPNHLRAVPAHPPGGIRSSAAPVLVTVEPPTVTLHPGSPVPVDLTLNGDRYGLTPDEALDLALDLLEAAIKARAAGVTP